MKLIIVRHGDPDYSIDSLTPKGWKEAELLVPRLTKLPAEGYYCSPLGRAKDTASLTMKALGKEVQILDWLEEFTPRINRPDNKVKRKIAWDWLPQDWMIEPKYYDKDAWMTTEIMTEAGVPEAYEKVVAGLDGLLAEHGYDREGLWYRAREANNDTLILFCHFGLECVLLSHLLNISPMQLWHGTCAAPTSVTTVVTEERREGIASWRMSSFGDISHLYAGDEPAAFAARFCECYKNEEERHD